LSNTIIVTDTLNKCDIKSMLFSTWVWDYWNDAR